MKADVRVLKPEEGAHSLHASSDAEERKATSRRYPVAPENLGSLKRPGGQEREGMAGRQSTAGSSVQLERAETLNRKSL